MRIVFTRMIMRIVLDPPCPPAPLPLAAPGRPWPAMAGDGWRWLAMAGDGWRWPPLAGDGLDEAH
jgi:hypothetical protein